MGLESPKICRDLSKPDLMPTYFNINYEFDIPTVKARLDERVRANRPGYICVADGNILQMVHHDLEYRNTIAGAMFSICDSSWVPVYLDRIYGFRPEQYCGSHIFAEVTGMRSYRQIFLGTDTVTLEALRTYMLRRDPSMAGMKFIALPFCKVEEFDYAAIADLINNDGADIIWVALGAPKQERFMQRLEPLLDRGVMVGVGAVFKFFSGVGEKRAPKWMIKAHLEFAYRLFSEPKKQLGRCWEILRNLPAIIWEEKRKSKNNC